MHPAADFCDFLWEDRKGMAVIALLNSSGIPNKQKFFQWPTQREQLLAYVESHQPEDVYTSPALFKSNSARKAAVASIGVVHSDADTFDVSTARIAPSLEVTTSAGHTHLYWQITDCTDPRVIETLAHGLSLAHPKKTTGMDNGWASNKLIRVPGTTNNKYDTPFIVSANYSGEVYSREEFSNAYAPATPEGDSAEEMGDLPSYAEALSSLPVTSVLMDLLDETRAPRVQDRSEALYLLEQELFRCGASNEQAFVVCRQSPFHKFAQDGKHNADMLLWEDILRARGKSNGSEVADGPIEPVVVTVAPRKQDARVDFLTDEEKDCMAQTWVDDYLAWATSKTDAPQDYHIAGALTTLSTILSEYGHAVPKFGPLQLNLWFMVLGSTTRSRKSTARALMLKMVNAMESEQFQYELGGDFTTEGLTTKMLEKPFRSSLAHRDECQDWFSEQKSKDYLSGLQGALTDMYGGKISGRLRSTSKAQKSVHGYLNLYAMGIKEQVADRLTESDFQSGFLTRFLFVTADAPERSRAADFLAQADEFESRTGDTAFLDLLERLKTTREFWDSFLPMTETGRATTAIRCEDVAWNRLNQFISDILDAAEGLEWGDIIESAAQRMSLSILKVATLLAMMDCCEKVLMPHMLSAINYAAVWFANLLDMAASVSSSRWRKQQDEIVEFISKAGGEKQWGAVYRFMDRKYSMRHRDFHELVESLQQAETVHIYQGNSGAVKSKMIQLMEVEAA